MADSWNILLYCNIKIKNILNFLQFNILKSIELWKKKLKEKFIIELNNLLNFLGSLFFQGRCMVAPVTNQFRLFWIYVQCCSSIVFYAKRIRIFWIFLYLHILFLVKSFIQKKKRHLHIKIIIFFFKLYILINLIKFYSKTYLILWQSINFKYNCKLKNSL